MPCYARLSARMIPNTFQALAVVLLVLLPGGLYELSREQRAGRWGLRGTDQIVRMLGFSLAFHVAIAPLTYWLYGHYVVTGYLASGGPVSGWVWVLCAGYLLVPFALGRLTALGHQYRRDRPSTRWQRLLMKAVSTYTDTAPAPRSWDHLFTGRKRPGWIVLHLVDGTRLAGAWNNSYASGYPEEDKDLFLSDQVALTADGQFETAEDGLPRSLQKSLLISWDKVHHLDFYEA